MEVSQKLTSLIIGDPHFKAKNILEGIDFIDRIVKVAKTKAPSFIVLLGDILDTHEIVRVSPHKLAVDLIEQLSQISPIYVLIGNHDLINHSQFLTDNHIFNPMKKWPNVHIVDTMPLILDIPDRERTFVFCPYTPPGRFIEALNKVISEGTTWELADCIFAHQEFEGCKMNEISSEIGDSWDPAFPPVISGHIHDAQTVGENIFYPGSAIQHSFGESSGKRVWFIDWETSEDDSPYAPYGFSVEKINLKMKAKRMLSMTVEELMAKEKKPKFLAALKKCSLKIKLTGTSDEFRAFRRSKFSATLRALDVKISYNLAEDESLDSEDLIRATRKDVSYREVLREVVSKRSLAVQNEYAKLFGDAKGSISREDETNSGEAEETNSGEAEETNSGEAEETNSGEAELVFIDVSDSENFEEDLCTECGLNVNECMCNAEVCTECGNVANECEC